MTADGVPAATQGKKGLTTYTIVVGVLVVGIIVFLIYYYYGKKKGSSEAGSIPGGSGTAVPVAPSGDVSVIPPQGVRGNDNRSAPIRRTVDLTQSPVGRMLSSGASWDDVDPAARDGLEAAFVNRTLMRRGLS